jgi:hypothetical protein
MSQISTSDKPASGSLDGQAEASLARLVAELFSAISDYAEVRRDRLGLQVQFYLLAAVGSFVGVTIFVGLAFAAALLLLAGIVGGLTQWLNGQWWAASLLTGAGFFVVAGTILWIALRHIRNRQVQLLRQKYETRRNERRRCAE